MTRITFPNVFAAGLGLPAVTLNAAADAAWTAARAADLRCALHPEPATRYTDPVLGLRSAMIDLANPAIHHGFSSENVASPVSTNPPAMNTDGKRGSRSSLAALDGYSGGANPHWWMFHVAKIKTPIATTVIAMCDNDDSGYNTGFVYNIGTAAIEIRVGNNLKGSFAEADGANWHAYELIVNPDTDSVISRRDGVLQTSTTLGTSQIGHPARLLIAGRGATGAIEVSVGEHGITWVGNGEMTEARALAIRTYLAEVYSLTL